MRELDEIIQELLGDLQARGGVESWDDGQFLGWAARIGRAQAVCGPPFLRFPRDGLRDLSDLPAVTTDLFRLKTVSPLANPSAAALCFRTSGTTNSQRGCHYLWRSDLYDASLLAAFDALVLRRRPVSHLVALVPRANDLPDSSLSYMLAVLERERFAGRFTWALSGTGLNLPVLVPALAALAEAGEPVLLFSTTLAASALLEAGVSTLLPPDSVLMTTGGAKGRRLEVDPRRIEDQLADQLGGLVVASEYGMTELLSQGYRLGNEPFALPPWCRVLAFDPATGRLAAAGKPGLLRFIDLANVQSALAVQTADVGVVSGPNRFRLVGRAPSAPLRGCSLTFEELAGEVE